MKSFPILRDDIVENLT